MYYMDHNYIYYMFIPYILFQLPTQWSQWSRAWEASPFWVVLPAESWGMLWRRQAWGAPQFGYVEICRNGKGVPWFPSTLPHISHDFPTKTPSNCKGSNSSVALQPSRRPIRCWSRMVPSPDVAHISAISASTWPVHGSWQQLAAGSSWQLAACARHMPRRWTPRWPTCSVAALVCICRRDLCFLQLWRWVKVRKLGSGGGSWRPTLGVPG